MFHERPRGRIAWVRWTVGRQVVGNAPASGGNKHALLWTPPAASGIDLNPTGFNVLSATGTDGIRQIGDSYGPPSAAPNPGMRRTAVWDVSVNPGPI